ncbi:phosphoribosyl transferase [Microbacterium phage Big4]|nr:phosphoribosyl transferase [Microbacterium phage Big4]
MITFRSKTVAGFTVDAPFKPVVFPDGAVHIQETEAPRGIFAYQIAIVQGLSHDDLFMLNMWAELCAERDESSVLILPYLPGARMDRGVPAGAKLYGDFILDEVMPNQLITIDPHSPAALEFFTSPLDDEFRITETTVFPVERVIRHEVQDGTSDSKPHTYVGVIAPDKGAHDRASRAARLMGVPVYQAEKTRDFDTGKLSGFHMVDELPAEGKLLIVDDICDGGGTFIGLAEATGLPAERVDLWVTHGIFSKGIWDLLDHFGTIHTTDSYFQEAGVLQGHEGLDWPVGTRLKVHKLAAYLEPEAHV